MWHCGLYHLLCALHMTLLSTVQSSTWCSVQQILFVSNKHHVIPIQVLVVIDTAKYLAFQFPKILFPSLNLGLVCFCISLFLPLLPLCNDSRLMTSWCHPIFVPFVTLGLDLLKTRSMFLPPLINQSIYRMFLE